MYVFPKRRIMARPRKKLKKNEKMIPSSYSVLKEEEVEQQPVLKILKPFLPWEVERLMEVYLRLYNTFQHLKELARINMDLLFLCVDFPEAKEELDKVQEMIQILLNKEEVPNLELVECDPTETEGTYVDCRQLGVQHAEVGDGDRDDKAKEMMTPLNSTDSSEKATFKCSDLKQKTPSKMKSSDSKTIQFTLPPSTKLPDNITFHYHSDGKTGQLEKTDDDGDDNNNDFDGGDDDNDEGLIFNLASNEQDGTSNSVTISEDTEGADSMQKDGPCKKCGVVLINKNGQNENVHHCLINVKKSEQESFLCTNCGKRFKLKSSLKRHLKIHEGKGKSKRQSGLIDNLASNEVDCTSNSVTITEDTEGADSMQKDGTCKKCGVLLINENGQSENVHHCLHNVKKSEQKPFLCPNCGKTFKRKDTLRRHLKIHEEKGKSKRQSGLIDNLASNEHDGISNSVTVSEDTEGADSMQKDGICKRCGVLLIYENGQSENVHHCPPHIHDVKKSEQESFLCCNCGKTFERNDSLRRHLKLHEHKEKNEIHKCEVCGKEFWLERRLRRHFKDSHLDKVYDLCGICGKSITRGNLKRHMILHQSVRPFKCSFCDKLFTSTDARSQHQLQHTGKYPYRCSVCSKGFVSPSSLRTHEKRCLLFGPLTRGRRSGFKYEDRLGHKHNNFHYECNLCQVKFLSKISMATHLLRHGEELTQCCLCNDKIFDDSTAAKSHIESVHLKEKSFKCRLCNDETCYTKPDLFKHRRTDHKDFYKRSYSDNLTKLKCEVCQKEFRHKANFDRHKRIHLDVKPYSCNVCGYQFKTRDGLRLHFWTHSKKKRFNCALCDKGFNDLRPFRNHKKICH